MSAAASTPTRIARLPALARLERLCDPGSLHVIRSEAASSRMAERSRPGDGVVGAAGKVAGRPIFCYAQDSAYAGGSLGEAHADTIVRVMRLAGRSRAPVVGFIDSGGARVQEGVAALGGYGRIFSENVALSARGVPQISVISGTAAGGGSYSPALTDFTVMTEDTSMFLTGPDVVREAIGEEVSATQLGGTRVHERNGVCQFVVPGDEESVLLARALLSFLPQSAGEAPPRAPAVEPVEGDPAEPVPAEARRVYDVREVARRLMDGGGLLEVSPRWAKNVVTAFARVDGRPVGVVANQPRHLGGTLDADAAQKAARFVATCNGYGLPLVVLVDTPGFLPGSGQEAAGVIRHGATLLRAFAEASVPRVTVVLRKAYGGAYITMNAKDLGADLTFAWPDAQIGVMGAAQAVGLTHRRELAALNGDGAERRAELAAAYAEEHLRAAVAARQGFVDEVIEPAATRGRLCWALDSLERR